MRRMIEMRHPQALPVSKVQVVLHEVRYLRKQPWIMYLAGPARGSSSLSPSDAPLLVTDNKGLFKLFDNQDFVCRTKDIQARYGSHPSDCVIL